jgi:hypothetical protein
MLAVKKQDVQLAWFSLINWHISTAAALIGSRRPLADPYIPIAAREIV